MRRDPLKIRATGGGRFKKRAKISPVDFLENVVRPALATGLDRAFPEFGFRAGTNGWWVARSAPDNFQDYDAKHGKLTANEFGFRSFKTSKPFVSWLEYVSGKSQVRGQDFIDAVNALAEKANVDSSCLEGTSPPGPEQQEAQEKRDLRERIFETFLAQAQALLLSEEGEPGREYLQKVRKFRDLATLPFGFFTTTQNMGRRLQEAGFTPDEINASGLILDGRWQGRLIGSWRDPQGRLGTFWARDLTGNAEDGQKYLYLAGPPKGMARPKAELVLAGLDKALKAQGGKNHLVIVEGVLDSVSLPSRGFHNVAAIGGGGQEMSSDKWETLTALGVKEVTLVMDNDQKKDGSRPGLEGLRAALKNVRRAKKSPAVFILHPDQLGQFKDPDELVRQQGSDTFRALLDNRIHQYRFEAKEIIARNKNGPEWTDPTLHAALDQALTFDASLSVNQALDSDRFFWEEILAETSADFDAIQARRDSLQDKKTREELESDLREMNRDVNRLLDAGNAMKAESLILEKVGKIKAKKRASATEPVRDLVEELDDNERHLERFRGKDWIGIPQKNLPTVDQNLLGLRGLMIMAGPPNAGKTALALQLAVDAVCANDNVVLVFASLEMLRQEMIVRIRCKLAGMTWSKLVRGSDYGGEVSWTQEEQQAIQEADQELKRIGHRIRILDSRNCPRATVERILQEVDNLKAGTGATRAMVLVDYLQVLDIPDYISKVLRTEIEQDKWRISQMKEIRDSLRNDQDEGAVIVISEARKPSGSAGDQWGGGMADVMGAARGIYTPDVGFLFRPLDDTDLARLYGWHPPKRKKGNGTPEEKRALKKAWAKAQREALNKAGLSPCILDIAKARDGMTRGEIALTFRFWELSFEEGHGSITNDVLMVSTPTYNDDGGE